MRPSVSGFLFKDGSHLTREQLVQHVRQALKAAGMDTEGYTGHSFRIGTATTAALSGVEDSVIKMLGRWESEAYQRYLQTPRDALAAVSARLISSSLFFHAIMITVDLGDSYLGWIGVVFHYQLNHTGALQVIKSG